ncbi:hypothetical protein [Mycobacterium sp.]|uniref:hypothetical protein n=1 Tax=Mycobacterium sp. TaxID=1785 RepID=UPI003F9CC3E8
MPPDGVLDQLPTPARIGATGGGGVDVNKAHTRATRPAVRALAVAPHGFIVADPAGNARSLTRGPASGPPPFAGPPTTCAHRAANSSSAHLAGPAVTGCPARPHHRRAAGPA